MINSPPTHRSVYSEEVLRACYEFCCKHDLYMISDETYDRLVFEGQHVSPAKWDHEGRVISVFTVSKTYSMTGWRVGYAVASPQIIAAMTKIQEPIVSCVNTVAQHAAIAALLARKIASTKCLPITGIGATGRTLPGSTVDRLYPHGAFACW